MGKKSVADAAPAGPSASSSVVVCGVAALILLVALNVLADPFLVSSASGTVLGGLGFSVFFLFLFLCLGNAEAVLFPRGRVCGWPETVGCLLVTYVMAGMVHPVCGTTSMFFSAVVVYYIHSTGAPARP